MIGWTTIENDLGVDFTGQIKVVQDLTTYLNSQGGIDGHPIKLDMCAEKIASGGAQCGNQFLQDKAVAVAGYSITDGGSMYPILKSGGISYLGAGSQPGTAADLTPDGNHFFITAGALGKYASVDKYITSTLHVKSVGVIVGTSAAAQSAATNFIQKPLAASNVSVKIASITESNPDYTSALNTLSSTDFLFVLTSCTQSDAAFKQLQALGLKNPGLGCTGLDDIKAMGAGATGVYGFNYTVPVDDSRYSSQADVKQYLSLASKYNWDHSENSEQAYGQLSALVSLVQKSGGATATAAQVATALSTATAAALPLGVTKSGLNCATPPSTTIPTACNASGLMVKVGSDGKVTATDGNVLAP